MTPINNPPIDNQPGDKETRDRLLFDSIAAKYAKKDRAKSSSLVRKYQIDFALKSLLKQNSNLGTIIEIACGIGAPAYYLKGHYDRYIGIDYSEQQIAAARQFNADNEKATFIAANIKSLDQISDKADLILAIGAIHHMTDITQVFYTLINIAKPGANFVAIEPNRGNLLIQLLRQIRAKLDKGYSEEQHYFLADELKDLIAAGGLTDIAVVPEGYFSPPLAQVIINPQLLSAPVSSMLVAMDRFLDNRNSRFWLSLSWNLVARGRFPL
jgi:ubiquinone/menaquinone biosynthesis C-methylase UbiE